MADYGKKNTSQRADWYRDVVGPICNAARAAGFPACGISASPWNGARPAGEAGSKLASGQWPATLRDRAEKLGERYGISFSVNTTLANLTNARAFVAEMQLEAAWSGGGEAGGEGAGDAGGGGMEDLYSSPDLWAPDGGTLDDTEDASAAGPGPWLWIGLGTAALAGGVVWWLRTRQPALGRFEPAGQSARGFEPSDGYYPWGP